MPPGERSGLVIGSLDLRTQEFELLFILAGQPGRVFTREQLLQKGWGFDFYGQTRTVDVHIAHLRKKLAGSSINIETVTGVGYKLVDLMFSSLRSRLWLSYALVTVAALTVVAIRPSYLHNSKPIHLSPGKRKIDNCCFTFTQE